MKENMLLQKEPTSLDQMVELLEDSLDSKSLRYAHRIAVDVANELEINPQNFSGVYDLDAQSFCEFVLKRAKQIETTKLI